MLCNVLWGLFDFQLDSWLIECCNKCLSSMLQNLIQISRHALYSFTTFSLFNLFTEYSCLHYALDLWSTASLFFSLHPLITPFICCLNTMLILFYPSMMRSENRCHVSQATLNIWQLNQQRYSHSYMQRGQYVNRTIFTRNADAIWINEFQKIKHATCSMKYVGSYIIYKLSHYWLPNSHV